MKDGKWEQTVMYVKRNEQGVIIQYQQQKPEDYKEDEEEPRYRVIGD